MVNINLPLFFEFVKRHENDDLNALRLKFSGKALPTFSDLDYSLDFALLQIECRRKCLKKLPSFLKNPSFLFPSLIASEQASNEAVAKYHASLLNPDDSVLDLTAGLGIDDMTFAAAGCRVSSCEIDTYKCDILSHNASIRYDFPTPFVHNIADNLRIIKTDSIEYLKNMDDSFCVIFADPARRDSNGSRVHALADCSPDIQSNLNLILNHTNRFLVKASPLLDLSLIINTVDNLHHIFVVCFRGECKEVLIEIRRDSSFSGITCVDLDWNKTISEFCCLPSDDDRLSPGDYADASSPIDYEFLYEPNAAVMKTGSWRQLLLRFPDLKKADANTHLFLSNSRYDEFPGRRLSISSLPDKRSLKALKGAKFNVVARNYPLSAPQILRKYGVVAGGNQFLYAFRYNGSPVILLSTPV